MGLPQKSEKWFPYMPWGLMNITVQNNGSQIFQFYLDFRDENWATEYYPSHDTYLNVDPVNYIFTLTYGGNNQTTTLSSGQTYQIWNIWGFSSYTIDLGTPVFVQNQYNSLEAGGSLNVASQSIPSGKWAITPNRSTCIIATNNERFVVPVGGLYEYRKHLNWNNGSADYLLSRDVNVPLSPFQQIAIFDELQPATISAKLLDNGSNLDNIQFRDPWYLESNGAQLNQFDTFTSPYNPSGAYNQSNGGVFLNQGLIQGQWVPPYYSIQAPVTKTVGGYTAVFAGWSYDPNNTTLQQIGTSPSGYDQKAVVFKQAGATITANYSTTTVSTNVTLPAGTYNFMGTLTVQPGATLTLNQGAILNFPSGAGLVVNGALVTNGATLTSPNGSSWKGITLTGANGSSISNTTISYALSPIIINSTSSITILGCTINHSSFYDNNSDAAAAIQVWDSSPAINNTTIEGQSNSWNGVRFARNGNGSLAGCTIENLGFGNGVIIQGGSSPTIFDNTIQNNYYHGITIYYNGTSSPAINSNIVTNNSRSNYVGIYFQNSIGVVTSNYVSGFSNGIWCRYASSPNSGGVGQEGGNIITNNAYGIAATDNSNPNFGSFSGRYYYGVCNQFYGNNTYDGVSETGSYLSAQFTWWGQYPANPSKFYVDGTSYIVNSYQETFPGDCPLNGSLAPANQAQKTNVIASNISTVTNTGNSLDSASSLIRQAIDDKFNGNYKGASLLCRNLLKDDKATNYHKQALVTLFNIFQESKDSTVVSDLSRYASLDDDLGITAKELLASAYEGVGKIADAKKTAENLKESHPNSEAEKQALFILTSLSAYDTAYNATSSGALNELVQKYGASIDAGIITSLGGSVNGNLPKASNQLAEQTTKTNNKDTTLKFELGNYPNPFNPTTIISYQLPKEGMVTIKIFDALGREVKTLVNEFKLHGKYTVSFDASNLASGVYFYQLKSGNYASIKKMILLK